MLSVDRRSQVCGVSRCERKPVARGLCGKHYQRWAKYGDPVFTVRDPDRTPEQRFWSFVNKDGPLPAHKPELGQCWIWTGGLADGYGAFSLSGRQVKAHILAYTWAKGEIPAEWQRDHLCRVRSCVNPDHLEAVPGPENMLRGTSPWAVNARKTHCPQDHEYTPDNTYVHRGMRCCKKCARQRTREWWNRTRSVAATTAREQASA